MSLNGFFSARAAAPVATACDAPPVLPRGTGTLAAPPCDLKVRFVEVLCRHGARTPLQLDFGMPQPNTAKWQVAWGQCRGNPRADAVAVSASMGTTTALTSDVFGGAPGFEDGAYGPCGFGMLTRFGEEQLRSLGCFLRRTYLDEASGMLVESGGKLRKEELYVRSTNTQRTIVSALNLVQGLIPEMPEAEILSALQIPYLNRRLETVYPNYETCDRLRERAHDIRRQVQGEPLFSPTCARYFAEAPKDSCDYWRRKGFSFIMSGDPLRSLRGHGLPLPEGASTQLADALDACGQRIIEAMHGANDREVLRLSAGRLLADIDRRVSDAVEGRSPVRLSVNSAHDTSVSCLLIALEIATHNWPTFASSVIMEALQSVTSGDWYVRVSFFDGPPPASGQPTAEKILSLAEWRALVRPMTLTEAEYLSLCECPAHLPRPLDLVF